MQRFRRTQALLTKLVRNRQGLDFSNQQTINAWLHAQTQLWGKNLLMNDKQLLNPLYLWYSVWKLPKTSLRMTFLTRPGLSKKKSGKKEKKRAKSSTALTALMCAYFKSPDLIRKNNLNLCFDLTGQGYYYKANCSFITTVHLIDLIRFWKKCPWIVCNIFC